jgi:hypothetical protein
MGHLSIAMAVMDKVETKTETELTSAKVLQSHVLSPSGQKLKMSFLFLFVLHMHVWDSNNINFNCTGGSKLSKFIIETSSRVRSLQNLKCHSQ